VSESCGNFVFVQGKDFVVVLDLEKERKKKRKKVRSLEKG
jgi:hypothetical protein